ncbi:ABC transporter ATP-binding protein, partial [Candidatus Bipolaricaulota bacterium]|nr:ABC transporter ATP-binding protein [Candidatus Bipolaricaulota bacterium]
MKRYKIPLALTMISMLALVGIQLLGPWLVRAMISAVTDPGADPETMALLARLAMLTLAVYLIRALMRFVRSYS